MKTEDAVFRGKVSRKRFLCAGCGMLVLLLTVVLVAIPTVTSVFSSPSPANVPYLRVAAFNIRRFGRAKMSNSTVAELIVRILSRYDLVLVQEVRDNTGQSLHDLWSRLNHTDRWGRIASPPVGRNTYKEQYVFFYRVSKARPVSWRVLPDPDDVYERDPLVAEFQYRSVTRGGGARVVFLALHSRPGDAVTELGQLASDVTSVSRDFPLADGVISMGDLNAGCRYVSQRALSRLHIFNNSSFTSLIPHTADTTAGSTHCAYDRVIVYGSDVMTADAGVFNFQTEFRLSEDDAVAVSDHYPVHFKLL